MGVLSYMSSIKSLWRKILRDIYIKGHIHYKDDAEIKEILNISGWIDNPLEQLFLYEEEKYLDYIKQGYFDIDGYEIKGEALAEYVSAFDDDKQIFLFEDNNFVYTYPERLKNMHTVNEIGMPLFFDQIEIMCERLIKNKGSNRAVATLYNVGLDRNEEHIPCLNWIQALIRDDKLFLSVMFRSNDIYNAFPSNMLFISYIGLNMVRTLRKYYPSLEFNGIYYQCSSAHYYTDVVTDDIIKKIIGVK